MKIEINYRLHKIVEIQTHKMKSWKQQNENWEMQRHTSKAGKFRQIKMYID